MCGLCYYSALTSIRNTQDKDFFFFTTSFGKTHDVFSFIFLNYFTQELFRLFRPRDVNAAHWLAVSSSELPNLHHCEEVQRNGKTHAFWNGASPPCNLCIAFLKSRWAFIDFLFLLVCHLFLQVGTNSHGRVALCQCYMCDLYFRTTLCVHSISFFFEWEK